MDVKHTPVEFLEDELPSWSNPHGVQLYLNSDSSLFLFAGYLGIVQPPDINLELTQEFKSLDNFLTVSNGTFPAGTTAATEAVGFAWRVSAGQVNILCSVEGHIDRELSFRKHDGKIWARDMDEKIHEVKVQLDSPEDYIAYTVGYYQVLHNYDQVNVRPHYRLNKN